MKLHVFPVAANSSGCIAVVKHLKLEDKIEIVDAYGKTRTPEFLKMNPCHTAPTLELDGDDGAIWESSAIMRFICISNDGGEELYPADPVKRGKIDMVLDWRQTAFYPCFPDIAYIVFGMSTEDEDAKKNFKSLMDEHFIVLVDIYLKDTKFCYSDTPTIADLAIGPVFSFLKVRAKFWDKVPESLKEYHARVLEAFPDTQKSFMMLDDLCAGYSGAGADLEP